MVGKVKHPVPRYPGKNHWKIHLSGIPVLVDDQAQNYSGCSPGDNRGILFKLICSLQFSIAPFI